MKLGKNLLKLLREKLLSAANHLKNGKTTAQDHSLTSQDTEISKKYTMTYCQMDNLLEPGKKEDSH